MIWSRVVEHLPRVVANNTHAPHGQWSSTSGRNQTNKTFIKSCRHKRPSGEISAFHCSRLQNFPPSLYDHVLNDTYTHSKDSRQNIFKRHFNNKRLSPEQTVDTLTLVFIINVRSNLRWWCLVDVGEPSILLSIEPFILVSIPIAQRQKSRTSSKLTNPSVYSLVYRTILVCTMLL